MYVLSYLHVNTRPHPHTHGDNLCLELSRLWKTRLWGNKKTRKMKEQNISVWQHRSADKRRGGREKEISSIYGRSAGVLLWWGHQGGEDWLRSTKLTFLLSGVWNWSVWVRVKKKTTSHPCFPLTISLTPSWPARWCWWKMKILYLELYFSSRLCSFSPFILVVFFFCYCYYFQAVTVSVTNSNPTVTLFNF